MDSHYIRIYHHVAFLSRISAFNTSALETDHLLPLPPLCTESGSRLKFAAGNSPWYGSSQGKKDFRGSFFLQHTQLRGRTAVSSKAMSRWNTPMWGRGCAFTIAETQ